MQNFLSCPFPNQVCGKKKPSAHIHCCGIMGFWGNEHSHLLLAEVAIGTTYNLLEGISLFIKILNVLPWPISHTCRINPIEALNKPIKTREQGCLVNHRYSKVRRKATQMLLIRGQITKLWFIYTVDCQATVTQNKIYILT